MKRAFVIAIALASAVSFGIAIAKWSDAVPPWSDAVPPAARAVQVETHHEREPSAWVYTPKSQYHVILRAATVSVLNPGAREGNNILA